MKKTFKIILLSTVILMLILSGISLLLIKVFSSCDYNAPLRKKMIQYYENDGNYSEFQGEIIDFGVEHDKSIWKILVLDENHNFYTDENGYSTFKISILDDKNYGLNIGDAITFMSAPMHFYNGHEIPIVYIKKENKILLSFSHGKDGYLEYIKETFS